MGAAYAFALVFLIEAHLFFCVFADRGTTYEFRVSGKNDVDYGERTVATIKTPDGGRNHNK